jgi:peptidoglycan/LPS O-acetylase OafA/YrhL
MKDQRVFQTDWPKRLYALDVSRGFAAMAVILWHWQHFAFKGHALPEHFRRENQPLYSFLRLWYENGHLGVDYFFLLSGFIFFWLYRTAIKNKLITAWEFGLQRFSRLYPLHLVTLLAVAGLQALYISREHISFVYPFNDLYHFLLHLGFASQWGFQRGWSFNAPIWSVSIEVLLYGVFFITVLLGRGGWRFCLSVSVSAFVISFVVHSEILAGLALFFLGGLVFHLTALLSSPSQSPKYKRLMYGLTLFFWLCVLLDSYALHFSQAIFASGLLGKVFLKGFPRYLLFPFTVCSLALLEIERGPFLKPISWIGDITYSSYLLHFPLQIVLGLAISFGLLNLNFYLSPIALFAFFGVLIPLSYLTFIGFERPMQNGIRHIIRKVR